MNQILAVFQRSLFLRVSALFLVTLTLIGLILQIVMQTDLLFWLFPSILEEHAEATSELVFLMDNVPEAAKPVVLSAYSGPRRKAVLQAEFPVGAEPSEFLGRAFYTETDQLFAGTDQRDLRFRMLRLHQLRRVQQEYSGPRMRGVSALEASLRLESGEVLTVLLSPTATFGLPGVWLSIIIVGSVFIASLIGLRIAFRPLKAIEQSANEIGETHRPIPVPEIGPADLRRVAQSLNRMQTRVQSLMADQSRTLAALAHDIGTSLTHMKLRLEHIEDEAKTKLQSDISHMERLLGDMLLYARSEEPAERLELIDLNALLSNLTLIAPIEIETELAPGAFYIAASRDSLRRAISNIIDNAYRYGGSVAVSSVRDEAGLVVRIDDEGPGIPEDALPHVFDPFYRAEGSRSRQTGGSGLGLTISRALLKAHGATLELSNRTTKGARATIRFASNLEVT